MEFRQLFAGLILTSLSFAASAETLKGRIWFSNGAPLAGAVVSVTNCVQGGKNVKTNSNGNYRVGVNKGDCHLTVSEKNPPSILINISGRKTTANLELNQSGNQWRLIRR